MTKTPFLVDVGYRIRKRRIELKLTQKELASKCKLHSTEIGAIERGQRNISFIKLITIIKALETLPSILLNGL